MNGPSPTDLATLQKLIHYAFNEQTTIYTGDYISKKLLKSWIVTLTDGIEFEVWSIHDLIYNKLPYILFSNNWKSIASSRRFIYQAQFPIEAFANAYTNYMKRVRKQTNFTF